MRAGYYMGNLAYEVKDIPEPTPEGDQVKIRVAWCGLCGTDVHKFQGMNGASIVIPPIILGHECSGVVVEVGPDCEGFKPGDRVACDPSWSCGKCIWCQKGLPNFCIHRHGVAKGFSDFVCPPESNVYHVADSLDLEAAAFAEPLSCAIHGMDLLDMRSGSTVVLFGMGAMGSLMLQLVLATSPFEVIVVEKEESKRELALRLGATHAVDDDAIEGLCSSRNIDYVIECIGLGTTMEQAIHVAGKSSKVLLFGLGNPESRVSFNQFEAYAKELSIYTSYLNPRSTNRAIRLLESGRIDTRSLISAELTLEEMGVELATQKNARRGKVMVRLSGER